MVNVCMVGHGMMGVWHSDSLAELGDVVTLHTVVGAVGPPRDARSGPIPSSGQKPPSTEEFAARYGYRKWTTDYADALDDPEIDVVVIASPSETHADLAIAAVERGKPTLVEIPIAMSLADAERIVATARERGVTLGMSHPLRFRPERIALSERVQRGEERFSHIHGRFFIHRLENVGATGLQRTWTDNLLWHHITHLIDAALWTVTGGDLTTADERIHTVTSHYSAIDPHTGIPMDLVLIVETHDDATILCTGSYRAHRRIYDTLLIGERDDYLIDELRSTLTTSAGEQALSSEAKNARLVARDFVDAVRHDREPRVPGWSVLPAMRVLQKVQDDWDARYGAQSIPGRAV